MGAVQGSWSGRLPGGLGTCGRGVKRAECWVAWGGVGHAWVTVCPEPSGGLAAEALAAVEGLRQVWNGRGLPVRPLVLNWFLKDGADRELCEALAASLAECAGAVCQFAVQPPVGGAHVAVEVWEVGGGSATVRRLSPWSVEVCYEGVRWLHVAGLEGGPAATPLEGQAAGVFAALERELAAAGFTGRDLVRTWIQVPDILGPAGSAARYRAVNRMRAAAFRQLVGTWTDAGRGTDDAWFYPASTGIGVHSGGPVRLAALALRDEGGGLERLALENPRQVPAYRYTVTGEGEAPLFSRAVAVRGKGGVWVWISGTASITGQEVAHPGDVRAQTEETLDNLEALLSGANFARHGWAGIHLDLADLVSARVYVKDGVAVRACREACARRLPGCPTVYVQADVCRPDLLVEIEGVAYRRLPGGGCA